MCGESNLRFVLLNMRKVKLKITKNVKMRMGTVGAKSQLPKVYKRFINKIYTHTHWPYTYVRVCVWVLLLVLFILFYLFYVDSKLRRPSAWTFPVLFPLFLLFLSFVLLWLLVHF